VGWDIDASFNYSQNTAKSSRTAASSIQTLLPTSTAGQSTSSGPIPPTLAAHPVAQLYRRGVHAKLSGYGFDLGSSEIYAARGPLALALGLQAGQETLKQNPNPLLATATDGLRQQPAGH
jgi:hypothetical protein